jgi:hypothetical protein
LRLLSSGIRPTFHSNLPLPSSGYINDSSSIYRWMRGQGQTLWLWAISKGPHSPFGPLSPTGRTVTPCVLRCRVSCTDFTWRQRGTQRRCYGGTRLNGVTLQRSVRFTPTAL